MFIRAKVCFTFALTFINSLFLFMKNLLFRYSQLLAVIFVFLIYNFTVAKSLVSLDNGELAATSYLLGIPHPPGYPLFTILGYIFSHIFPGMRVIEKLNLLSSIYATISVFFTIKISEIFLKYLEEKTIQSSVLNFKSNINELLIRFLSIISGLIFAFSKTFWFQATNYEVYTFQIFLVSGMIYFSLLAYQQENFDTIISKPEKFWLITFLFFAGIISNHPTGAFFILFVFLIYLDKNFSKQKFNQLVLIFLLAVILSALLYSYIPIRASSNALAGFGLPYTFKETIEHISAKIYRQFFFYSVETFFDNLSFFLKSIWFNFDISDFNGSEFGIYLLFLPISLFFLLFVSKRFFLLIISLLLIYIIIPASYKVYDIDQFFTYAYWIISILIAGGVFFVAKFLKQQQLKIIFSVVILFTIHQLYFNYHRVNNSSNFTAENYYKKIVGSLEPNSVLINKSSWFHSMTLYFQFVEKFRIDVVVILQPLITERWYITQLNNWYKLKDTLVVNENGNLIFKKSEHRKFYFTFEMLQPIQIGDIKISEEEELAPYGLCFRLTSKGDYIEQPDDIYEITINLRNNIFNKEIEDILYQMILFRIDYELNFGYETKAKKLVSLLQQKFPERTLPDYLINLM